MTFVKEEMVLAARNLLTNENEGKEIIQNSIKSTKLKAMKSKQNEEKSENNLSSCVRRAKIDLWKRSNVVVCTAASAVNVGSRLMRELEGVMEEDEDEEEFHPLDFVILDEAAAMLEPDSLGCLLHGKYRMHPSIAEAVSREFYRGKLKTDSETAVVVLSFYNGQKSIISKKLLKKNLGDVEVMSVDSMQGREAEVVVLSCVRTLAGGSVGFLADRRRVNVAISRARQSLVVIGDEQALMQNKLWKSVLSYYRFFPSYRHFLDEYRSAVVPGWGQAWKESREAEEARTALGEWELDDGGEGKDGKSSSGESCSSSNEDGEEEESEEEENFVSADAWDE
ncbi:hypothetical protein GUITHDRAFT_108958 [Guillardia theta CCMP2712]|uniref:DNA2/NAM7 helicase-like C-terminal domain-containing protein n=1 Tax=Guillardia theta (strain CCMP2712) TaxID=905079 RepID=L1JB42_GUITC|nr:hypothetical protein GUITHDRAFT_108958 [Guillardia theta CCMP2712]EKX45319.1 hypothetical protein GUITHDRAFT_108958 [Guillardia theta CCMP2712]|eukprot:XP_005832299.1 hypothetical protein GUITHDRAFT_108958 [Guillardia theta CCMP2712]